ncbi:HamA C-terminal domain-containing protein [Aureicoccus marinus]|uniref:Anti-bacteriophage protein A/HamA C-terminal domain-containing protein n=1 Tax=Aureicoccus marinus TaxID=754435 RepID=A0A2S7T8G5_9FLAO|nr:DUF1837 domain-containing protein [Aureicoccus marinus]PQJ15944.1 hypothetical protein BST99_09600 [Aureicoccus marinus]
MSWIENAIKSLLLNGEGEIHSRIEKLGTELNIDKTQALGYCYFIKLDGQGNPRTQDLIEFVAAKIIDYSIPKKLQDEASEHHKRTGSFSKISDLEKRAKALFTDLNKTGEFGEMLLYTLVQEILELPQLISKMSLKSSGKLHYQGADGIHVKFDPKDETLALYWGESKMQKKLNDALKNCFDSLKGFLLDTFGHNSTQTRDLELITQNLNQNINNPELEKALVRYFDLDDDMSNKLKYRGVCFVGFESNNYPSKPFEKTLDEIKDQFLKEMDDWLNKGGKHIKTHVGLESFEIHVFLIPFPSVQKFRDNFLELIGS